MKSIEQIQEFVREKCIMAAHPKCKKLKDALEIELGIFGCLFMSERETYETEYRMFDKCCRNPMWELSGTNLKPDGEVATWRDNNKDFRYCKIVILGLPLTLARVLKCEFNEYCFFGRNCTYFGIHDDKTSGKAISIAWKLLNKDGTDCLFEQQEESTQRAIYKLLGGSE